MERAVAIKKLAKLLGKNLGYRVDPKAPTQDQRDAAQEELKATLAAYESLKQQKEARFQAILAADPEYQRLKAECQAEGERRKRLASTTMHYRFTVGTSNGMFFLVKAQGDSWEQVIDKLTTEQKAAA